MNDSIHELEMKINKMVNVTDCCDQNVIEIKNHLIDLYQRVGVALLKKHSTFHEKLSSQNNEWQETCDQLISENQNLKSEKEQCEQDLQSKNEKLTTQLDGLKTEHYKIQQDNEENTLKLKNELSNSLNVHYLKNILTSYFTTMDTTVQQNLIKVVFNVLKYSTEEQEKVMETWNENNKGYF